MAEGAEIVFQGFRFDAQNEQLFRGAAKTALRPKSAAVLHYLLKTPHRLVSKKELMLAAWPGAKVVDAALRVSIQEIRKALGDESKRSKFIETVGKKGYRFIAPVSLRLPESGRESFLPFVGRSAELDKLRHHFETANSGKRRVVFVTGEPGIGKTTLVEAFINSLSSSNSVVVARGRCIEQYGAGEAYMPMIDALEQMCSGSGREQAVELLRRYAPSWLVNLPALIDPGERGELEQQIVGITPERRLREIATLLETLSQDQTLLLVLEDLHWLDPSSLALISFLARRREAARLMVIGTYREGEVESYNHPLGQTKGELELHEYCSHLPLKLLSRSAVGEYLAARFETPLVSSKVTSAIYRQSEGNPLFMVNMTDYLIGRQAIIQQQGSLELGHAIDTATAPASIRQLIERQFERLAREDQELLEVASVRGVSFSAAVLAAVLAESIEIVESQCRRLTERAQFLQPLGTARWPDGTVSSQYSFVHALYQNVIYDRVGESRKARMHQTIGERLEAGYRVATEGIAVELAHHFERAGDYVPAVKYLLQAAQRDFKQCALQETVDYCNTGLALLKAIPPSATRNHFEISFVVLAGFAFASLKGYAAVEAEGAFSKARGLSQRLADPSVLFQTLAGLWSYYLLRGELRASLKLAQQMLALANRVRSTSFLLNAHMATGCSLFYLGDISTGHRHLHKSRSLYDLDEYHFETPAYGWDPGVIAGCYKAKSLWLLGYPDKAEAEATKVGDLAARLSSPFHLAAASGLLATYHAYRGDSDETLRMSDATISISSEGAFSHWLALGTLLKGWALAKKGELKDGDRYLREGIANWQTTGAEMALPTFLALQAEARFVAQQFQKALASIDEGFAVSKKTHETYYDAELYRLTAELLPKLTKHQKGYDFKAAETFLLRAVRLSRAQRAKSLELRSIMSLCGVWQRAGKAKEARKTLAKTYDWFTEGFDTPDLRNAKALLDELS